MTKYLVQLEMPGMKTSFDANDKESTIDAFTNEKNLVITRPNGDNFVIRMKDYSYMSIDAYEVENES